jgi:hypothetical protein
MGILEIFALQFVLSLIVFSLLAKWYVAPWLADKPIELALTVLIFPHALRHVGMLFLVPGVVGDVPSAFALAAAYGDLAAGLLALITLVALRGHWRGALSLAWLFNIVGTVDLANALRQAEAVPYLAGTWSIPTFVVPVLLVTHFMVFARLVQNGSVRVSGAEAEPA